MTEQTRIENSTYNILRALGKEADFLYSTVDTYIEDARKDNRTQLVETWNEMKRDDAIVWTRIFDTNIKERDDAIYTSFI